MRALCGAIITAGALIGLGLAALGFGTRYQGVILDRDAQGHAILIHWMDIDRPLMVILVSLVLAVLVGLAITFVGLAYHHHRRHHELLHLHRQAEGAPQPPRVNV